MTVELRGIIPAMLTPLGPDRTVDENGTRRLVDFVLEGGASGVFVLGTSGEFELLATKEQNELVRVVVDQVAGRVPVLVGASAPNPAEVSKKTNTFETLGATGVVVLPPYYHLCGPAEIVTFYSQVAGATALPIVIYNNPSYARTTLSYSVIEELLQLGRFIGIKDSSGDFGYFTGLLQRFNGRADFQVMQGHENYAAASFLLGGRVAQLGLANIVPDVFVDMLAAAERGDVEGALALQRRVDALAGIWDIGGQPESSYLNSMKGALELFGVCGRGVSAPFKPFNDDEMRQLAQELEEAGLTEVHR